MFTERLNELIAGVFHTTTTEFARIGNYDRSYIAHLRNGDRVPKPGYKASERLVRALCTCAEETGTMGALRAHVDAAAELDGEALCAAVTAWLYKDQFQLSPQSDTKLSGLSARKQKSVFGSRLDAAMELANISNQRLSRAVNVDASVISKFRSGQRIPSADQPLIHKISAVLIPRIYSLGRIAGLSRLTGTPQEALTLQEDGLASLEAWLRDFSSADVALIERFLDSVDRFTPGESPSLLPPDQAAGDAVNDTDAEYPGIDGFRRAMLRFLGCAIRDGRKKLYLYSDQDMDWMTGDPDFNLRWMSLMTAYVHGGGTIRVVHNVDRGLEELLTAIQNWLPLYLSGMIEGLYCVKKRGSRFTRTLFLEPEGACISSDYVSQREANARYRYLTTPEELDYFRQFFSDLLLDCKPLFHMQPAEDFPRLSSIRKDPEIHTVCFSPSLASMPEELLLRMLDRAAPPEEVRRELLADWTSQREMMVEKVRGGTLHECVPLPDETLLFAGQLPVDTKRCALCYTPAEYAEHMRHVLALESEWENCHLYLLTKPPYRNLKFAVSQHSIILEHLAGNPIAFTATHPMICRAFLSFALLLEHQQGDERLKLTETLARCES